MVSRSEMFRRKESPADTGSVCCRGNVLFFGEKTPSTDHFRGRKDFLPVEPQGRLSFLILLGEPSSPKTTPVATWLTPDLHRTHGRPPVQEYRLRLKRPTPHAPRGSRPTAEVVRQVDEREEFRFA